VPRAALRARVPVRPPDRRARHRRAGHRRPRHRAAAPAERAREAGAGRPWIV